MLRFLTSETANKGFDTANKIVQILAVIGAAIWANMTFSESVRPGLEDRSDVDMSVYWVPSGDPSACIATLSAQVKNTGVRSFDILRIRLRGWIADQSPHAGHSESFDVNHPVLISTTEDIMNTTPFYSEFLQHTGGGDDSDLDHLGGHYPPGTHSEDTWSWSFRRDGTKEVLFRIDLYDSKGVAGPYGIVWDPVCPSPQADAPSPSKPSLRNRQ